MCLPLAVELGGERDVMLRDGTTRPVGTRQGAEADARFTPLKYS